MSSKTIRPPHLPALAMLLLGATLSADGEGFAAGVGVPEPQPVAEQFGISGAAVAQSVTFAPDGNEFYFVTGEGDRTVIKGCRRIDGRWREPVIASFVGADNVETPSLSPDGTTIFFAGSGRDIWAADKNGNGWNAPRKLDRAINSESWESSPSAAANGSLYFVSGRTGRGQVFRSRWENGRHLAAEKLGDEVNQHRVQELFIAPDESYLLFGVRPVTGDRDDIFISFRSGESWTPGREIGPAVNSVAYEGRPSVSPDGRHLYFTRNDKSGPEIMRVEWPRLLARLRDEALSAGPADARHTTSTDIPVEYWHLSTGSRIGYVHFPAANQRNAAPIVFLHGGPGGYYVATYPMVRAGCERLAQHGFDVFLYDQIGSGFSDRLPDPRDYTLDRHVADLEAIRRQIGTERLILVGTSHGATLAATYLAVHPDRVGKAIFVSPGVLDPAERKSQVYSFPTPRVSPGFLDWIRDTRGADALRRYQRLDTLLRTNVPAAYAFAGDKEMDPLMDAWTQERILIGGVADPAQLKEHELPASGMGWWSGVMTLWDEVNRSPGVRARLASCDVPALILRGDADFLPSELAEEYAATLRRSKLIRIPAAGHLISVDQPEAYRATIKAFLFDANDSTHAFH